MVSSEDFPVLVVVPYLRSWYFREVLRGVRERLEAAGRECRPLALVEALETGSTVEQFTEAVIAGSAGGVIVAGLPYGTGAGLGSALAGPTVIIGKSFPGLSSVHVDEIGIGRTVTSHLLSSGARTIAYVNVEPAVPIRLIADGRREKGYQSTMGAAGLPTVSLTPTATGLAEAILAWVGEHDERPLGIFANTDEIAFECMKVLDEVGLRRGEQVLIAGVDDHPQAAAESLSTVRQDPAQIGGSAVDLLLEDREIAPHVIVHPTRLITRSSTRG